MDPIAADPRARRLAIETYRTVDAFEAVAWRPPSPRRYDARPANDHDLAASFMAELKAMPGWVIPVTGAIAAALMGLLLGGWLAV